MLSFISSLFGSSEESTTDLDESVIDLAIERAVDGTDVRLRAVRDYKKRLREPVITAVEHIISKVDEIPPATELSPEAYSDDPRLRAFFASPQRISDIAGNFPSLRELRRSAKTLPVDLYGLLSMDWSERNVLGMGLMGDQVQRGVSQVVVNFSDHRFLCPSATEEEARRAIMRRVYDYILAQALGRLANIREERSQLRGQQRLLKRKLECMDTGQWGLESMMFSPEQDERPDQPALELEIAALDAKIEKLGGDSGSFDAALEMVSESLVSIATSLSLHPLELHLDYRGVRSDDPSAKGFTTVELEEVHAFPDRRRIILMCRLPRAALPAKKNFLREAERLLQ